MNMQFAIKILLSSVTLAIGVVLGGISPKPAFTMELVSESLEPSVNSVGLCWENSTLQQEAELSSSCAQEPQLSTTDNLLFDHMSNQVEPYALLANTLIFSQFAGSNPTSGSFFSKFSLITDWLASPTKLASPIAFSQNSKRTTGYIASSNSKSVHFAAAKSRELPIFSIIGASFGILGLRYIIKLLVDD